MKQQFKPDYKIHPGQYLKDILETRYMTRKELAKKLKVSYQSLSNIINCKKLLTEDLIVKLEKVLGISASLFRNLNNQYIND